VANSFFGRDNIAFCNATSFSAVATRVCFIGRRLSSGLVLAGRMTGVLGYRFRRAWVEREVKKAMDWRICFGFEDCREWKSSSRFVWRSCSDIIAESRRVEDDGDNKDVRCFVRA
jgi:hypothetical protein